MAATRTRPRRPPAPALLPLFAIAVVVATIAISRRRRRSHDAHADHRAVHRDRLRHGARHAARPPDRPRGALAMRVLVTAASRHGATREIASAIADGLARRGVDADARPADELTSVDGYDAFVIGSAVYVGHWLEPARDLVDEHAAHAGGGPGLAVQLRPARAARHLKPEGDPVDVAGIVETVGALDHRVFAGRLDRGCSGSARRRSPSRCAPPRATSATGRRSTPSPARSPAGSTTEPASRDARSGRPTARRRPRSRRPCTSPAARRCDGAGTSA